MMTSALALSQILSLVSKQPDNKPFLTATADCLNVSGPEAEIDVLKQLVRLVNKLTEDVESLGLDDKTTATLKQEIVPFAGITNLSHVHQEVRHVKAGFMKPDNLTGLIRLHAAFAHTKSMPEISDDVRKMADEFRTALQNLLDSDVPDKLKDDIARSLRAVIASLDNYYFFSERQLNHSLEALVGTLVLHPDEATANEESIGPIKAAIGKLLYVYRTSGQYLGITRRIAEDGKAIADFFGMSGGGQ